jgi:DNA-binding CsgD family transcriptional regulator
VIRPGGIIAHERLEDTIRLHRLIAQTARLDQIELDTNAGVLTFTARGEPNPNVVFVSPVANRASGSQLWKNGAATRYVLLTIHYRRDAPLIPHERLMRAFGFSRAESQLVAALAHGTTLSAYAEETARSVHTIRAQLKQALLKADCHKQAELVALVSRLLGRTA